MEELELTDPVVTTTTTYKVLSVTLDLGHLSGGYVGINLQDNTGGRFAHAYTGEEATDYIRFINTANFTVKSLHKRILERLSLDGVLPGTVTGAPDPPA